MPWDGVKLPILAPFHMTLKVACVTQFMMTSTISCGIRASSKVSQINGQHNPSYDFSSSILIAMKPFWPCFLCIWSICWATIMSLEIHRLETKLLWVGPINLLKAILRWFTIVLAMALWVTLHSLIGHNWVTDQPVSARVLYRSRSFPQRLIWN